MTNRAARASLNPQLLYVLDATGNPVPATLDQLDGGALSETIGQLADGGGRRFAVGATTQRVDGFLHEVGHVNGWPADHPH